MAQLLTVAQAAMLTHHNERAVRWRIAQGHLPATHGDDGHMRVALADLEAIPGWRVDTARLDELQRHDPDTRDTLEARIRALETRVQTLERLNARVAPLEGRQVALPSWDDSSHSHHAANGTGEPVGASFASPPRRAPAQTVALTSELPPGWVAWRSFAVRHGIAETTVQKAIDSGRLPAHDGKWKHDRVFILRALDEQGQAAFYRLYGGMPHFRRCDGCPHTPVASAGSSS